MLAYVKRCFVNPDRDTAAQFELDFQFSPTSNGYNHLVVLDFIYINKYIYIYIYVYIYPFIEQKYYVMVAHGSAA